MAKGNTRGFTVKKVITPKEMTSYVDIKIRGKSSLLNLDPTTIKNGLVSGQVYQAQFTIGATNKTLAVTGSSSVVTIADLSKVLHSQVTGNSAKVEMVNLDNYLALRFMTSATGSSSAISLVDINLVKNIKGDDLAPLKANISEPCIGGGINFELTNVASQDNPMDAGAIVQATDSTGTDIPIKRIMNPNTGNLQIKKASGFFAEGDSIVASWSLFGGGGSQTYSNPINV